MALIVSLVFLLLLTLIGISSMQNATLQEKMSGSVKLRNESFQFAEAAVRLGESAVQATSYKLATCTKCTPPAEAASVQVAGANAASGVTWTAIPGGFWAVQKIATTKDPVNVNLVGWDESESWTLYRITGVGVSGNSRTVVESIYAKR
ncbi:pilus assembly PilX family protein [Pseudomonas petrae]|uniref:PilX N-terminal domain-containing pilus assembly protein n=1 Tax=Pseudomonas petrae TaxID=2912190 RepID=A0ABS9IDB8_9PSED|nr:PilX N-terminal domain-containing pilus assembly protein [Pseudomonas petrae]MCF7531956.1 PilX N-terminal domain-containing pilus assembly protein [Pseudomonas petrae]MCF7537519.1 PilX N-terminal domain-containing pilus assembly protein [Pseudomonas petrae]MCF7545709.1 PilX N-terminal domain-containing pilus assembly protein [Pseudomonas petrae]MCF7556724.1 PilX N-terminal domain-containing pilus assembly protein [Pseudomonas petrae]